MNFVLNKIGVEGILRLMDGRDRRSEFQECLAYLDERLAEPRFFMTHIPGELTNDLRGPVKSRSWSVLAQVFVPDGSTKTFAQMSDEELAAWHENTKVKYEQSHGFAQWFLDHHAKAH